MSSPRDDGRLSALQVVLFLIALAMLARAAFMEPILPDEEDCRAMGRPVDCWREFDRPIYDELGRRVR